MKIKILLLIMLLGCRSSSITSFNNINNAFINWYFKYNPVESTRYNINRYDDKYRHYTSTEINEYRADISRFLIELSQIDVTKISPDLRIDYNMLYNHLEKMQYILDDLRPWEWNPLWILDQLFDGIYILTERIELDMNDRVESIKSRLTQIPKLLDNSKLLLNSYSTIHVENTLIRIDDFLDLLQELPLTINSDNMTLDYIDSLILNVIEALNEYKLWCESNKNILDEKYFPTSLSLYDKGFYHFIGAKYQSDNVYELAVKKLNIVQNRLFDLSLPLYILKNDEPVWLDRNDTLEVIEWTVNSIMNKPEFKINNVEVLSKFYESLTKIEQFCYKESILPQTKNKTIELSFAPKYNRHKPDLFLFDEYPKNISTDIIYNIQYPQNMIGAYNLNQIDIDFSNIKSIIPGYAIQLAYSQKQPSMVRYLFPDFANIKGWQSYVLSMLINEGYSDFKLEYKILKLRMEIITIVRTIVENEYYSGRIDRVNAIQYLDNMSFINSVEAEKMILESELNFFIATLDFVGTLEIDSILGEFKRNEKEFFKLSNFHKLILEEGQIPLLELKKKIFSH